MLLNTKPKDGTRNRNKPGTILVLKCDACEVVFERPNGRLRNQELHACSRKCHGQLERRDGPRDVKKRQTSFEHYGVEHPRMSPIVENQRKRTCFERYGVEHAMQVDEVRDRVKQTVLLRYGVSNVFKVDEVKQRIKQTLHQRYGVEHPLQSQQIRDKVDWSLAWHKAHETKKANGTYASSRVENQFYERLMRICNVAVKRQTLVNGWSIDFQVGDVYVQFDGVYWHGLDRPIEVIAEHKTERDATIHHMWLQDREQDEWFSASSLTLIRITDRQAKTLSDEELRDLLTSEGS